MFPIKSLTKLPSLKFTVQTNYKKPTKKFRPKKGNFEGKERVETHRSEDWVILSREVVGRSRERRRSPSLNPLVPRDAAASLKESSMKSSELRGLGKGDLEVLLLDPMGMRESIRRGHGLCCSCQF